MTNFEMIKNFGIENMALTIMCPVEAGLAESYRCDPDKPDESKCVSCCYDWLKEESL